MPMMVDEAILRVLVGGHASPVNLDTDSGLKVMLLASTYTPSKDHIYVSEINTHELSGTGYVGGFAGSGRKALTTTAWVKDSTNHLVKLTADNPLWTAPNGITARYAAIIKEITDDAASLVLAI